MRKSFPFLIVFIVGMISSGCTWIKEVPESNTVRLMTIGDIQSCEKLGEIKTSVLDKVGFIERDKETVVENLVMLAKNEAVKLGGDTIVPASNLKDGEMRFWLYQCAER
ncbi:DUF4156 domain-containing protein [Thiomicrorhabdus indica]|uniref:DUF4156 domain-containing protein n=1 Tax=Thiomicrorhabdus indica TaxID=2267253 RepID=UPI002AA8DA44|nr:DUF4156 domain-containing protein [Thiomicrorhabdus indica]